LVTLVHCASGWLWPVSHRI